MKRRLWLTLLLISIPVWIWVGWYTVLRAQGTHTFPASSGGGAFGAPAAPATTSVVIVVPRSWEKTCRILYTPLVKLDAWLTGDPVMATWDPAWCHGGKGG